MVQQTREQWSGSRGFVLAVAGSAIGLGNIWKFPYMAGANGGGAFVLVYLLCILAIGVPIMIAEILVGRRGQSNPVAAMRAAAEESGVSPVWRLIGGMGVLAGFLILSFYSVIAGWALDYTLRGLTGALSGLGAEEAQAQFGSLLDSPGLQIFWHTLFMLICFLIVARGVRGGIEWAVGWMMPLLFLLILVLVGYGAWIGAFAEGFTFLFRPDFSQLGPESVLMALGQAFFSLSLGMGAVMAYGSYLSPQESIGRNTVVVITTDTIVALLAGLMIFPIVFSIGLEPQAGPGLLFQTLPYVFGQMVAGSFFGFLFFLLVVFAALTSAISLLEPATAYLMARRGLSRLQAAGILAVIAWILGIFSALSFNLMSGFHPLGFIDALSGKTFFDLLDGVTSNIMLPLGGLGVALFVGWRMKRAAVAEEVRLGSYFGLWYFVLRFVSPVLVVLVLLYSVGVLRG
ncbi:MAG: sodium-dependent transporter [Xanthomonadaceae bacterium]|nr:sodium-dependent transporter [Xanthomonadaceae bacterium]